jgi:hypothetical protein
VHGRVAGRLAWATFGKITYCTVLFGSSAAQVRYTCTVWFCRLLFGPVLMYGAVAAIDVPGAALPDHQSANDSV